MRKPSRFIDAAAATAKSVAIKRRCARGARAGL